MPKYLIDMPEGWGSGLCNRCPVYSVKSTACGLGMPCPLANAVEAVEVRLVEDGEAGAGIIDKTGRFYHEEDTLYAVSKEADNGKAGSEG